MTKNKAIHYSSKMLTSSGVADGPPGRIGSYFIVVGQSTGKGIKGAIRDAAKDLGGTK